MAHETSTAHSEFAIPNKIHELVSRIQRDLLAPLRAELVAIAARRDAELNETQAKRAAAEAEFKRLSAEENSRVDTAEKDATKNLDALSAICAEADAFLQKQGLTADPVATSYWRSDISHTSIAERTKQLKKRTPPLYWPKSTEGRWAVVISALILLAIFAPLVLAWPAIVYVWKRLWDSEVRGAHALIAGDADALSQKLRTDLESVRSNAQAAIAEANRSRLEPVLASASASDRGTVARFEEARRQVEVQWKRTAAALMAEAATLRRETALAGADWQAKEWVHWSPDDSPEFGARLGTLALDVEDLQRLLPQLDLHFELPALIPFSSGRCLLLEAAGPQRQLPADTLQSVLMRVLATTPPGKGRFTFVDPIGLGHNVADFMALSDFDKDLIAGKAWTEPRHINEQLAELTEHMETVIQKYLRREFTSILDYNQRAQEVAEPFRFLVVFDFPVNFTDESARLGLIRFRGRFNYAA